MPRGRKAGELNLKETRIRCRQCGQHVNKHHADATYCSPKCKQAAYRARKADLERDRVAEAKMFDGRKMASQNRAG